MNPSWTAVAAGAVGLAVLDGVLRPQAASNVGGWIAGAGKAVEWFLSPAVPAFKSAPASPPASSSAPPPASSGGPGLSVTTPLASAQNPPASSAASQPTAPVPGGADIWIPSPVGPVLEGAA